MLHLSFTRNNITRHHIITDVGSFRQLCAVGGSVRAEFNRQEVKSRSGTRECYWDTISENLSTGQFLGYTLQTADAIAAAARTGTLASMFSREFPLLRTDGGHRGAWMSAPEHEVVLPDGQTLAMVRIENPEEYDELMAVPLSISFMTSPDHVQLEQTARDEYARVNILGCSMTTGEVMRATIDSASIRGELMTEVIAFIEGHFPETKSERDSLVTLASAIINGIALGFDHMTEKDTLIDDSSIEVSEDAASAVRRVLGGLEAIERHVAAFPEGKDIPEPPALTATRDELASAPKSDQKRLKERIKELVALHKAENVKPATNIKKAMNKRTFTLAAMGPIVYGLATADGGDEFDVAVETVRRWYGNGSEFLARCDQVKKTYGPRNTARYYNEARYQAGWNRIRSYDFE